MIGPNESAGERIIELQNALFRVGADSIVIAEKLAWARDLVIRLLPYVVGIESSTDGLFCRDRDRQLEYCGDPNCLPCSQERAYSALLQDVDNFIQSSSN